MEKSIIIMSAYNIFDLCNLLAGQYLFDKLQYFKLWKSLFKILYEDKETLKVARKDKFLEDLNCHAYDCDITDQVIFLTENVKDQILKWIDENRQTLITKEMIETISVKDLEQLKSYMIPFPSTIAQIIFVYMGVDDSCLFCCSAKIKETIVEHWCRWSPKCQDCGISYVHHYGQDHQDFNIKTGGVYNSIMTPLDAPMDKDEKDYDNIYCPFGICACCDGAVPSYSWRHLSFGKNTYYDDEVCIEFETQISHISCSHCSSQKCNSKKSKDYECHHTKRSLTRFKEM